MSLVDPTRPEALVPARRTVRGTSDRSIASFVHAAAAPIPPAARHVSERPAGGGARPDCGWLLFG